MQRRWRSSGHRRFSFIEVMPMLRAPGTPTGETQAALREAFDWFEDAVLSRGMVEDPDDLIEAIHEERNRLGIPKE
jgi:hypothetical protein